MDRDTVQVYEERADAWRDRRPPRFLADARALARNTSPGAVTVDLGCGAGGYLPELALARPSPSTPPTRWWSWPERRRPARWPVQADLEALPFRRAAFGAAWARASYLHVANDRLPLALADLHRSMVVGAPAHALTAARDAEWSARRRRLPGTVVRRVERAATA